MCRDEKLRAFWELPVGDEECSFIGEPRPLSSVSVSGDEILVAVDTDGNAWIRNAGGDSRRLL